MFDALAPDFVRANDEGQVVAERAEFSADAVVTLLGSGRMAPAGAGCISLAWQHRDLILD